MKKSKRHHPSVGDLGYWDFPGGCIEDGEDLKSALQREVLEETGLTFDIVTSVRGYDVIQQDRGRQLIIVKYACINPRGELQLSDEHDCFYWIETRAIEESELPASMKQEVLKASYLLQMEIKRKSR